MMLAIERTATQWIEDELSARRRKTSDGTAPPHARLQLSPAKWVLPKLLRIIYQNTNQPVEALAPLIRSMLSEQVFATTGGDPCDPEQLDDSINQTVALLISVLERVRRQCMIQPKLA
ncbi:MAG: hypothetical protein KTR15_15190 [Phycisphaeraceae bacterium]|nr:hypothetical protein [Phycisphaeraceae bacterium]